MRWFLSLTRLKLHNSLTTYNSFFLPQILTLGTALPLNKVFNPSAQHSLLEQLHAEMVPLIGRIKLFNEFRAYVLPSLLYIALVQNPFHFTWYQAILPYIHLESSTLASYISLLASIATSWPPTP
jgi:hypothetical protein